jgi:hypothetical protein
MSKPTPRTWTIDERIDAMERKGIISPPFTDIERALARAAIEAWYFVAKFEEMPARCEESSDGRCWAIDWGIGRMLNRREETTSRRPGTSPATQH